MKKKKWIYLNSGADNAFKNMQKDQVFLEKCIDGEYEAGLRIYSWNPVAVSLGRNQDIKGLNNKFIEEQCIDVVTRPTGGRAVYHQGDITYCFVINASKLLEGESVNKSYKEISTALIFGLEIIGIKDVYIAQSKHAYTKSNACMAISTGADLEFRGKKLAGSAQLRKNGFILQHGSILVNQDFSMTAKLFNVKESSLKCFNVEDILGLLPSYETLSNAIKHGFEKTFSVVFDEFV